MQLHAPCYRLLLPTAMLCLVLGAPCRAEGDPPTARLGKKIENVTFKDAAGKSLALHDLKDKKAVVVVFLAFDCPMSNNYVPLLADLEKSYRKRGVAFVGVCATEDEDAAQIAKQAQDYRISFPVFRDQQFAAADAFKAEVTPEVFVLDDRFVLRYRGRIDDGYVARLKKNLQITRHDLRQALDEVLAGKPVSEPATLAFGCPVRREVAAGAPAGKVTYHRDVLPILQARCQECHRPGAVGPFSLLTYKQALNWANDIKEYTQTRQMPPWKVTAGPAFHSERKMPDAEIATLAAWVDGGVPEGDPREAPLPRTFPDGWHLGKPDLVLSMDCEFELGPSGNDLYRCFVLPTNLPEDTYVSAIEVRPGNAQVVHHALMIVDTSGQARKLDQQERERPKVDTEVDRGTGYSVRMGFGFRPRNVLSGPFPMLGGWAPGQVPRYLPEGYGYLLPKGSDIVMQMHYHRSGRPEKDRTSLGLYFAKKPPLKQFQGTVIPGRFLSIPSGDPNYRVQGDIWVDRDCTLYNVLPHMHLLGKSISVTMTPPNGPAQTLLAIKDWDYNWQETYWFKEPIAVKAGTKFSVEAFYDNSEKNLNNPNRPPKRVINGQQTTDEMCFVFLGVTSEQPGRILPLLFPPRSEARKTP